jgi:hypothetical protein
MEDRPALALMFAPAPTRPTVKPEQNASSEYEELVDVILVVGC